MTRGRGLLHLAVSLLALLVIAAPSGAQSSSAGADTAGLIRPPLDLEQISTPDDPSFTRLRITGDGSTAGTWFTIVGRVVCDDPAYFQRFGANGSRDFLLPPTPVEPGALGFAGDYSMMPMLDVGLDSAQMFVDLATGAVTEPPTVYAVAQPLLTSDTSPNKLQQLFATDYHRWSGAVESFWDSAATDQGLDPAYLTWDAYAKSLVLLQGAQSGITANFFNTSEFKTLFFEFGVRIILQVIGLQSSDLVPNAFPDIDDPDDQFGPGGLDLPSLPTINISNSISRPLGGRSVILPLLTHPRPAPFGPTGSPSGPTIDAGTIQSLRIANIAPGSSALLAFSDGTTFPSALTISGPQTATLRIPASAPPGPVWITRYSGISGQRSFAPNNRVGFVVR